MASGDYEIPQESAIEPFLTSEEWLLIQSLSPKYRTKIQKESADNNQAIAGQYLGKIANGIEALRGVKPDYANMPLQAEHENPREPVNINDDDPDKPETSGSGVRAPNGGFDFAPIVEMVPKIIPLIGPVISKITDGIRWITKKIRERKERGRLAKLARMKPVAPIAQPTTAVSRVSASGVFAPNIRYAKHGSGNFSTRKYLQDRLPEIQQREVEIRKLHGSAFWRAIFSHAGEEIANACVEMGINPALASKITSEAMNRLIPGSFVAYVNRDKSESNSKKAIGSGSVDAMVKSIIKPLVKYGIQKTIKGNLTEQAKKLIDTQLNSLNSKYSAGSGGLIEGGAFWHKAISLARKATEKLLPQIANIAGSQVNPLIARVFDRFKIENPMFNAFSKMALGRIKDIANPDDSGFNVANRNYGPPRSMPSGKGSMDMAEKMARLRAMKGKKSTKKKASPRKAKGEANNEAFQVKLL